MEGLEPVAELNPRPLSTWLSHKRSCAASEVSSTKPIPEILSTFAQTLGPIWDSLNDASYTVQILLNDVRIGSGYEWSPPKQGHIYLIVDVTIKNPGPGMMRSVTSSSFRVRDANGVLRHDNTTAAAGASQCSLGWVDLASKGSVSGCIGFEVPLTGTLELIYALYQYDVLESGRYLSFTIRQ